MGTPATLAELADAPVSTASFVMMQRTDVTSLSPSDQLRFARLCQRVEAHALARRIDTVAAFAGPTSAPDDPARDLAALEVGAALRLPPGAAVSEVARDRVVSATLPAALSALRRGEVTFAHVRQLLDATSGVRSTVTCAEVEARVLPRAASQTAAQLGRCARRAVADLDPAAFETAHERATASVDVTFAPVADAMAYLTAYLPVSDAALVMRAVEAAARTAKADGDRRPLGVLRGLALLDRFAAAGDADRGATSHGRSAVEVHVVATVETMLGLADTPGEIPGVSPLPASLVRTMARDAALRWLTIDAHNGRLLDISATTYRVPTAMAARVNAEWVTSAGPGSTVEATRCDLDHLAPYPLGSTSPDNLAPVDRRWHRAKTLAGVTVRRKADGSLEWTTPLGQRITVTPYDYRLGP